MESDAFNDMRETQKKLSSLQKIKVNEELKKITAEHQRCLMEVQEVYARFLFLLKLIVSISNPCQVIIDSLLKWSFQAYFDEIVSPEDIDDPHQESKLPQQDDIMKLQINERTPVGQSEVMNITTYMNNVVRPYLEKRNHLNADIWIKVGNCNIKINIFFLLVKRNTYSN